MTDGEQSADWHEKAKSLSVPGQLFIEGDYKDALSKSTLQGINPVDSSKGFVSAAANAEDVDLAVKSARSAYASEWVKKSPRERGQLLKAFADIVDENADQIALCDCLDVGKTIASAVQEAHIAAGFIRYYAEALDKVYSGHTVPTAQGAMEVQLMRPRGVVGAVIPWNFPSINVALKAGPALAAGNTMVIKPSDLSPRSALLMAKLATEAGLPAGVINVVTGGVQAGSALVEHPCVDMLTFTGSGTTGKALLRSIGSSTIKPILLECGGKSPEIIFPDIAKYGLKRIAEHVTRGMFWNQGQVCVARSRLLLHSSIYDEFLDAVVAVAKSIPLGDPLDADTQFGPLASVKQKNIVEGFIASGIEDGAKLILDGRNPIGREGGCYVGPTIFTNVPPQARISQEEIFGPVLSVFSFDTDDEALNLANDNDNGLAATIWTTDLIRANQFASQLNAGKIKVMASPEVVEGAGFSHSAEPCGQSGYGVEGGISGLNSYMRQQSIEFSMG